VYSRLLTPPDQSFFLFGPRGTGKTAWLRETFPSAIHLDLLDGPTFARLVAAPGVLEQWIPPKYKGWVVLDEIQRIPELLNEVHRLIESRRLRFALTGSSARALRRRGVNLLAGRALTRSMHPLTATELGGDFDLRRALQHGTLPFACTTRTPEDYLAGYTATYLREEVQQEGMTRNLAGFGRFLGAASFSQASVLSMAGVSRECGVGAKTVEGYFSILEDLLIAIRLPVFARRAKRRLTSHPKFYYFDAGVYRALRPRGPLDSDDEIRGATLETLVLQHLRAWNDYAQLGFALHYWRTRTGKEVGFVLYGARGLVAIEVKCATRVTPKDLESLRLFMAEYPMARAFLLHLGPRSWHESGVEVLSAAEALVSLPEILAR